ncbi:MAG: extracellular solute-binding protein [Anaerolineales bacterium]|jgi:multiple sugar transport system substrate-binding protein/sn-glycerol 3-phosphate transport system substrate-binding protein|nr:extracellular solute-binding protein [Anaerolineales bacterium]
MKSKSIWAQLLVFVTILSILLAACTPKATETATPEPVVEEPVTEPVVEEPVTEPVEIVDEWADVDPSGQTVKFWHQHTRERETALLEIVDEFNKTNEYGITVVAEYQGGYGDIFNKMLTFMNTSDVPNLVVAYQNQAATYQLAEALVDMNPMVNSAKWGLSEEDQADFFPGFWEQDVFPTFSGARLGFPPNRSMEVLYYNLDWLKEMGYDGPPTTPEQFKEMACKAAEQPFSKATSEGSMGYQLSLDASRFASWTFAFGGDIFDYTKEQYSLNNEATNAFLTFMQDLFNSGCATIVTESYGDQTDFGAGKLLFTVGSSSGLPFYKTVVDEGAKFAWSVGAIPHTTAEPVMNIYGASVSIPKSTPEQELAAFLFVKYYTNTDVQAKWAKVSQYFPVRASVAEGLADVFAADPAWKTAFDMLKYGHYEPPVPGYDFVRDMMESAMDSIVNGSDVASTLAQLEQDGNASLAEQMAMVPESPDPLVREKVDPTGQSIKFWHNHTKERETALLEIIDEFNKTNEYGITVTAEYQGSYNDIFNKMLGFLNTADVPDLVVAYQNQAATYQVGEGLVDINTYVNSYKWGLTDADKKDFFKGFYNQDIFPNFGNARLGFPPNRSMEVLYYNMDWLKELGYDAPPTTPEQFKEMACKAVEQPFSKATSEGSMGYQLSIDASRFASWTFAFGGDVFDYKAGAYTYNSDASVAAMTFLQDLFKSGCAAIVTENYGDQTDFGAGKLLFSVGSSSGLPFYKSAAEAGAMFEWSVAPIPYTTEAPAMNVYGASVSMPKTTPERQLATWLFLKYYTSPEVQAKWAMVSNYFPVRASVAEELTDYFAANPTYKTAFDLLQYSKFEPPTPGYDFVRNEVNTTMAGLMADPYPDVATSLTALNDLANSILAEWMTTLPTPAAP